jgi:hypothetical protein
MSLADEYTVRWASLAANPRPMRRHVVILGAGASVAAFPKGDVVGRMLPVMSNLVDLIGLDAIFARHRHRCPPGNFEAVYSALADEPSAGGLRCELETTIYNYFNAMRLPKSPTMYDVLLLALRPKDVVATFNWDPFLFDAFERNNGRTPLPEIVHLHGNVRIGYCPQGHAQGRNGTSCPECSTPFVRSPLLFPVTKKDYTSDPLIANEWNVIRRCLTQAFTLTIFGYGAPSTDVEAVRMLLGGWKEESDRSLENIEVIDVLPESEIHRRWSAFFTSQHCLVFNDFYRSWIPRYPRRTCEALFVPTVEAKWVEGVELPRGRSLVQLWRWVDSLVEAENQMPKTGT